MSIDPPKMDSLRPVDFRVMASVWYWSRDNEWHQAADVVQDILMDPATSFQAVVSSLARLHRLGFLDREKHGGCWAYRIKEARS